MGDIVTEGAEQAIRSDDSPVTYAELRATVHVLMMLIEESVLFMGGGISAKLTGKNQELVNEHRKRLREAQAWLDKTYRVTELRQQARSETGRPDDA